MKFKSIEVAELRDMTDNIDGGGTIAAPERDQTLSTEQYRQLRNKLRRRTNDSGESLNLFYEIDTATDASGEKVLENFTIDIEALWKIVYEHQRYEDSQGFSEPEMQVLRAIEFHPAERVGVDEIEESEYVEMYAQSTIYKALRGLREKSLIERVRPGVYRYVGV